MWKFIPTKISFVRPSIVKKKLISATLWCALTASGLGNWDAAPIDVHEWGVNTFDWNTGKLLGQELPTYLYTDKKPGNQFASPKQRVRDLPPDSGVRTKPILYFYPSARFGRGPSDAQVGVEMRFAYGYANAWWPQVNRYRTEEQSNQAKAPDWKRWRENALDDLKNDILKNNKDGKANERWIAELEKYDALDPEQQTARLAGRIPWLKNPGFPEDQRMQLTWEKLTLHDELPSGQILPGKELPNDHWAKIARDVDAAYVSNTKEVERYVFYEGKTREETAIALLPANGGARFTNYGVDPENRALREVSLVNVGKHAIYDVIAIYRDREKGILWTGHLPVMEPRMVVLRIPDFKFPGDKDQIKLTKDKFRRKTTERLIENLTAGAPVVSGKIIMRDPADTQGPTERHQLFRKEAVGLEKIWHDDFFEADGFTVIYRESPEYLDEAMPLNIFTSMFWHIRLSRCGLVLNRNLPLDEVYENERLLWEFQLADWNTHLKKNLKTVMPKLKKNRLLTLGQARFYLGQEDGGYRSQLDRIRKIFDDGHGLPK